MMIRTALVGAALLAVLALSSTAHAFENPGCIVPVSERPAWCGGSPQKVARAKTTQLASRRASTTSMSGIVAPLASKVAEIVNACGSEVISAVRPGAHIAGTSRMSLHAYGKAVDVRGNPSCIYSMLQGWPGGYSTDYSRVKHVHISYDPSGREWGIRFVHGGHRAVRVAAVHR